MTVARRRRLRLGAEDLHRGRELPDGAADSGDESAAADRRNHGLHGRKIFEDLQPQRRVTGDEVVIVEGCTNEPSILRIGVLPSLSTRVERRLDECAPEVAHPLDLVSEPSRSPGRQGCRTRARVGHTLPRIPRADWPHPFRPLLGTQHGHRIRAAPRILNALIGCKLSSLSQISGRRRVMPQLDQRRPRDDTANPLGGQRKSHRA